MAINKADYAAFGKMFGELMALKPDADSIIEFVERYILEGKALGSNAANAVYYRDKLRPARVVLQAVVGALLEGREDLWYDIETAAKGLADPIGGSVERRRRDVEFWVKFYRETYPLCDTYLEATPCRKCKPRDIRAQICWKCGKNFRDGPEQKEAEQREAERRTRIAADRLDMAKALIKKLARFALEFERLEPEFVVKAIASKHKPSAYGIAAVLSYKVGAFGDNSKSPDDVTDAYRRASEAKKRVRKR